MRAFSLLIGLLLFSAARLPAQVVVTQDSSLRKLQRTYVRFLCQADGLSDKERDQLVEYLTLELRKAGFTIADKPADLKDDEGLLEVSLRGEPAPTRFASLSLRMSLQQRASLKRTGQSLWMVTWYDEARQEATAPDSAARALIVNGTNRFLNRWLAANGR